MSSVARRAKEDEVARAEDLEIPLNLGVEARAVEHGAFRVGAVRSADLHLLQGEGVADDVLGEAFEVFALVGLDPVAAVDVEAGVDPAA